MAAKSQGSPDPASEQERLAVASRRWRPRPDPMGYHQSAGWEKGEGTEELDGIVVREFGSKAPGAQEHILLNLLWGRSTVLLGLAHAMVEQDPTIRVRVVGLPGSQDSARTGAYGSKPYAEWLSRYVATKGINKFNLIGLSLGSAAAGEYAAANPEKVNRVALMAPPTRLGWLPRPLRRPTARLVGSPIGRWAGHKAFLKRKAKALSADGDAELTWRMEKQADERISAYPYVGQPLFQVLDAAQDWERYVKDPTAYDIQLQHMAAMIEETTGRLDRLKRIGNLPTLVVRGERDGLSTEKGVRRIVEELPNAAGVTVEEAGHNPAEKHPERLAQVLHGFFKGEGPFGQELTSGSMVRIKDPAYTEPGRYTRDAMKLLLDTEIDLRDQDPDLATEVRAAVDLIRAKSIPKEAVNSPVSSPGWLLRTLKAIHAEEMGATRVERPAFGQAAWQQTSSEQLTSLGEILEARREEELAMLRDLPSLTAGEQRLLAAAGRISEGALRRRRTHGEGDIPSHNLVAAARSLVNAVQTAQQHDRAVRTREDLGIRRSVRGPVGALRTAIGGTDAAVRRALGPAATRPR